MTRPIAFLALAALAIPLAQAQPDSAGLPPLPIEEPIVEDEAVLPPPLPEQAPQQSPEETQPAAAPIADDTLGERLVALQNRLARLEQILVATQDSLARVQANTDSTATTRAVDAVNEVAKEAGETVRNVGLRALISVVLLVLSLLAVRGVVSLLEAFAGRSAQHRLFYKKLIPIARLILWTFTAYLIVAVVFEIDSGGIFTALAAIGVGVAFAAQDILKNIFGGLVIVFDQPFQVGDKVRIGESYGEVVSIGLRSTRLTTPGR